MPYWSVAPKPQYSFQWAGKACPPACYKELLNAGFVFLRKRKHTLRCSSDGKRQQAQVGDALAGTTHEGVFIFELDGEQ